MPLGSRSEFWASLLSTQQWSVSYRPNSIALIVCMQSNTILRHRAHQGISFFPSESFRGKYTWNPKMLSKIDLLFCFVLFLKSKQGKCSLGFLFHRELSLKLEKISLQVSFENSVWVVQVAFHLVVLPSSTRKNMKAAMIFLNNFLIIIKITVALLLSFYFILLQWICFVIKSFSCFMFQMTWLWKWTVFTCVMAVLHNSWMQT